MKALTLTQPWATLVAIGAKRIETRSWRTGYRGPLAIHAGKNLTPVGGRTGLSDLCGREPFRSVLDSLWEPSGTFWAPESLPLGCVVAIADLVDCHRIATSWTRHVERAQEALPPTIGRHLADGTPVLWELTEQEIAFGDYTPGRFAWLLDNVRMLPVPVPARGAQGLWDWDATGLISEGV